MLAAKALRSFVLASLLMTMSALPLQAKTRVTMSIGPAGDVVGYVAHADLAAGKATGTLDIIVRDDRGLASGWNLTLGGNLPLTLVGSGRVTTLAGQPVALLGTKQAPGTHLAGGEILEWKAPETAVSGAFGLLRADTGAGSGVYALHLDVVAGALADRSVIDVTIGLAP